MSSIQVWTSDGRWSEPVQGLDKLHFMRAAIIRECSSTFEFFNGKWDAFQPADTDEDISLKGITIDGVNVNASEVIKEQWNIRLNTLSKALSKAKIFQMRLSTLLKLADEDVCLSTLYKKLVGCANVPSDASDDYGLLFRFSAETYYFACEGAEGKTYSLITY